MPLITSKVPRKWKELEELVAAILGECGMTAERGVTLTLPRDKVTVDVLAEEVVNGITDRTICQCKNWQTRVPKSEVHSFRTVMQETGANRGLIISRRGFQSGAVRSAQATNIELMTFTEFQEKYFKKWIDARLKAVEAAVDRFHSHYELGGLVPGSEPFKGDAVRTPYNAVWKKYLFAAEMLSPFSPYLSGPLPTLPFDVSKLEQAGVAVPDDIKTARGYREFLELLTRYAVDGRAELRAVNPI